MNRMGLLMFCGLMILASGATWAVSGQAAEEQMCVPMGIIPLNAPEGVKSAKGQVDFPHARHFASDCRECHHTWEGEENIQNCTASGCHDMLKAPAGSKDYLSYSDVSIRYFKYAYHQKCIGCHKQIREKNRALETSYRVVGEQEIRPAGPSGCKECHYE